MMDHTHLRLVLGTEGYSIDRLSVLVPRGEKHWLVTDGAASNRKAIRFPKHQGPIVAITHIRVLFPSGDVVATEQVCALWPLRPGMRVVLPARSLRITLD